MSNPRMLLDSHPNLKEAALKAHMEYSNYVKACKMERDMYLNLPQASGGHDLN